jgi:GNAT superfamily N-acetyltransferase
LSKVRVTLDGLNTHLVLELIGYSASVLIAISLMMRSILRLRVINMIGGAGFSIYGLLIGAYPVAILNALIVGVNAYQVTRMLAQKEYFQLLELRPDSVYLPYFLRFYTKEIRQVLPEFEYQPTRNQLALFILRDCNPAGAFIAEERAPGILHVTLDFVVPPYRDLKIGRYLFVERAQFFRERGISEIVVSPRTKEFKAYLAKVGFLPATSREDGSAFHIRFGD